MFTRRTIKGYRIIKNPEHGFTGDRDRVACINLFLNSRCTGSIAPVDALKPYTSPSRIQGKQG
ncbi:hypothetical protein DKAM_0573 [Desulfurococcus amylolyticus 1221n]|uniref:Uncharacterized protein n=1 Tax=Desulfurococcus amylolyticus (strain DSM 18924 / JCM 16383 / VKM B-2413 / 1221n) TaxID=490899 RepID=B8D468_DESA1|nr:hypothetical protein [Desulfurococcus amylolyticus]ACL10899.1 hypothetical protein DKAM_0573 [Desulfurococcus amylolyticus 1221n]